MIKYESMLKKQLKKVYFIRGSKRVEVANAIAEKYSIYIYHMEDTGDKKMEKEDWRDLTTRTVVKLIELSEVHGKILCEGDPAVDLILPIASHIVTISENREEVTECPEERQLLDEFGAGRIFRAATAPVDEAVDKISRYFGFAQRIC
ncbi:MAG: hypothetical protein NC293_11585 [Roseburia sp.]|nr:hypothetical protein [Roseburia sp.]